MLQKFLKQFSVTFSSNIILLLIRTTYIFILPKFISVASFGYWQLYFLYSSFVHLCHLGLVDGVYLKNGGLTYAELDKNKIRPQIFILILQAIFFAALIYSSAAWMLDDANKIYIFAVVAIDIILTLPRTIFSVIFQATGMIKQFSSALLSEAVISFILVIGLLTYGVRDFKIFILADCVARVFSLGISIYFAPNMLHLVRIHKSDFMEAFENIKIGIFLLLSNMAGLAMLAIIRLAIEYKWGIVIFSKISLAFSMANMIMVAVNAASIVLFPILKRLDKNLLQQFYYSVQTLLVFILFGALILYYPGVKLLSLWLPQYIDSLMYLAVIAPMCLYESQTALVINNYLKAERKERTIFAINVASIAATVLLSSVVLFSDISIIALLCGVLFISMGKVALAEYILGRQRGSIRLHNLGLSIVSSVVFIAANYFVGGWIGFNGYLVFVVILFIVKRRELLTKLNFMKSLR